MRVVQLEEDTEGNILSNLSRRDPNSCDGYTDTIQQTMDDVKGGQGTAVFEYTVRFDSAALDASSVKVTEAKIKGAVGLVESSLLEVMRGSMKNIRDYHQKQVQCSWFNSKPDGTIPGQRVTALESAGAYVPDRKATYPSSVLMDIIPTEVAGVKHIVMVTPPGKNGKVNPVMLMTAYLMGTTEIYKTDSAQAVAALASGIGSISRVSEIVGPGDTSVALVKKAVYGHVDIDGVAGPSEILMLTGETANPRFATASLLSQVERDGLALAMLVTVSIELAERVSAQMDEFVKELSRREVLRESLENFGCILVADSIEDTIDTTNKVVSEHLEIVTKNPSEVMTKIQNAGATFVEEYDSGPLGDYFTGPNHVLPTNGMVRFFPPLGIDDSIKKPSIIYYSREVLEPTHKDIITFMEAEQLTAYANSIRVRFEE